MDDSVAARRILVVEDDFDALRVLRRVLVGRGYEVGFEVRGYRAPARILQEMPDLVIVGAQLGGSDGLELCRRVRDRYSGAILMLSDSSEEQAEVLALSVGADGFMAKPVTERLLLARSEALLRRPSRGLAIVAEASRGLLDLGELRVDGVARSASLGDRPLLLTSGEFDVLWALASSAGKTLTRDELYNDLLGRDWDGEDRAVDLRIARLRRKLEDDVRQPRWIRSVRGAGYVLSASSE